MRRVGRVGGGSLGGAMHVVVALVAARVVVARKVERVEVLLLVLRVGTEVRSREVGLGGEAANVVAEEAEREVGLVERGEGRGAQRADRRAVGRPQEALVDGAMGSLGPALGIGRGSLGVRREIVV